MTDARSLSADHQEALRQKAIRLRKRGRTYRYIADLYGVHPNTVFRWVKTYEKSGAKGIKAKSKGPRGKLKRGLTPMQELKIIEWMLKNDASTVHPSDVLWTSEAVYRLVTQRFKHKLTSRTVHNYMRRWGIVSTKPDGQLAARSVKIRDQDETQIFWWEAKELAHWSDRVADYQKSKPYAQDVVRLRAETKMLSITDSKNKLHFHLVEDGWVDLAQEIIRFLTLMLKQTEKSMCLVARNALDLDRVEVKEWIQSCDRIVVLNQKEAP
ncbi:helix-turn-helix domain containing protein [Pseudomaricurvus alkylphenolicus]|uniref:helix-turn-helix domain-containing protein n=1 Tax=Pseudomaricurvus alkylphenolicus TaxID=1306991 RepID=UPI0014205ADF|nr:helix-turn-helix domain-containing protein [Pseudomaricurvus alkylphenolicus]NIB45128.1 helix-turn-helix domain containing protein [Pseudomaricurvus alkylphenolicus]